MASADRERRSALGEPGVFAGHRQLWGKLRRPYDRRTRQQLVGAAHDHTAAHLVNPHALDNHCARNASAVEADAAEQKRPTRAMQRTLLRHDNHHCATTFLDKLG